jgi:hypothetical protein
MLGYRKQQRRADKEINLFGEGKGERKRPYNKPRNRAIMNGGR